MISLEQTRSVLDEPVVELKDLAKPEDLAETQDGKSGEKR
jgi:hypothetical protein